MLLPPLSSTQQGGREREPSMGDQTRLQPGGGPRAAGQKVSTWITSGRQALAQRHGPQSHAEHGHDKYFTGRPSRRGEEYPKLPLS